jgi:hypothetical protein
MARAIVLAAFLFALPTAARPSRERPAGCPDQSAACSKNEGCLSLLYCQVGCSADAGVSCAGDCEKEYGTGWPDAKNLRARVESCGTTCVFP